MLHFRPFSQDTSARLTAAGRRVPLPLAVVFLVLATAGWIVSGAAASPDIYERQLDRWAHATLAGRPLPSPEAPPDRISRFFAELTERQRERLARDYPLVVGNLPGAPLSLRYQANRRALAQAREIERERMRDERLSETGRREAGRLVHRFESMLAPGRQILSFDPTGRGRAAEVFGDLGTAQRISVVVPGVDTQLLTFERTQRKYTAPSGMAEALYQEQQALGTPESTAVIAWADYEAPTGLGMSAATARLADGGADRLLAALDGLPGGAPIALFCHSYGSVVCGVAAGELPARVTDIAVTGSPGMRASDVSGLDTGARVWAMRNEDDWIGEVPHLEIGPFGHGNDPYDENFGARLLSSEGAEGHGGYFTPGADSLHNMALIGAGSVNEVTCAPGVQSCAPLDPCTATGGL